MNAISITIKISSHTCATEVLTATLGLIPTDSHGVGESYIVKTPGGEVEKKFDYNYWEYREEFTTSEWVQTFIDKFIREVVLSRKDILKKISTEFSIEFFCRGKLS